MFGAVQTSKNDFSIFTSNVISSKKHILLPKASAAIAIRLLAPF